jgi:hypothetical protein
MSFSPGVTPAGPTCEIRHRNQRKPGADEQQGTESRVRPRARAEERLQATAYSVRAAPSTPDAPHYANAAHSTRLDGRQGFEDRRHRHAVGVGADQEHSERKGGDVLLEFQAAVHRQQHVVLAAHVLQQVAILDASPATANNRVYLVAVQISTEVYEQVLVKKDAHQPRAWRVRGRVLRSPARA